MSNDDQQQHTGNPIIDALAQQYAQLASGAAALPEQRPETEERRQQRLIWEKQQQDHTNEIIRARDAARAKAAQVQAAMKQESDQKHQQWSAGIEAEEKEKARGVWLSVGGTNEQFERGWADMWDDIVAERAKAAMSRLPGANAF